MENNKPIHNQEHEKLAENSQVYFAAHGKPIKVGPIPLDFEADMNKILDALRSFMVTQDTRNVIRSHKITCYKRLLESEEVTLTEEGKRQKGIIDRL